MVGSVCSFLHNPYVNLRLSTSLISLSRCLCLSLSLCSLIWSKDRMSFFSLLGDLRSRLFVLWGPETKYKMYSRLGKSIWKVKITSGLQMWMTSALYWGIRGIFRLNVNILVPCFWFWHWWQALLWTCPWLRSSHFALSKQIQFHIQIIRKCVKSTAHKLEIIPHFSPLPSFPSPSDFSSFPSDLLKY